MKPKIINKITLLSLIFLSAFLIFSIFCFIKNELLAGCILFIPIIIPLRKHFCIEINENYIITYSILNGKKIIPISDLISIYYDKPFFINEFSTEILVKIKIDNKIINSIYFVEGNDGIIKTRDEMLMIDNVKNKIDKSLIQLN